MNEPDDDVLLSGAGGTTAWNLVPTLVAVRGKMVSSGSNVQCNCGYMQDKHVSLLPSVSSATVY
jgi:hypothetical protein